MRVRLWLAAWGLCAVLVLSGFVGVTSPGTGSLRSAGAASAVLVSVGCDGAPEVTRVKNNGGRTLRITAVGSVYQPRSNEPFRTNRSLSPGGSVAFETGSGANANVFTRQYIYNSDVGSKEGARVATSLGTFVDRC